MPWPRHLNEAKLGSRGDKPRAGRHVRFQIVEPTRGRAAIADDDLAAKATTDERVHKCRDAAEIVPLASVQTMSMPIGCAAERSGSTALSLATAHSPQLSLYRGSSVLLRKEGRRSPHSVNGNARHAVQPSHHFPAPLPSTRAASDFSGRSP